jgi:hypothetical protein
MSGAPFDRFHNEIRCPEIHIGNPERDDVISTENIHPLVILDRMGLFSIDDFIEIIMIHHGTRDIRHLARGYRLSNESST